MNILNTGIFMCCGKLLLFVNGCAIKAANFLQMSQVNGPSSFYFAGPVRRAWQIYFLSFFWRVPGEYFSLYNGDDDAYMN
jgi:hypothetical protein